MKADTNSTYHVYSTLKRRENGRLHVAPTWDTCGVFVGKKQKLQTNILPDIL